MDSLALTPFCALVAELPAGVSGGLCLSERADLELVTVMAQPGFAADEVLAKLANVVAVGPGTWLGVVKDDAMLLDDVEGVAVFDQRSAFGLLEINGADTMRVLQKGVFIDLATALAADGASLCSVVARINLVVWRVTADRFIVAIPRSFTASFWHWLTVSANAEGISLSRS